LAKTYSVERIAIDAEVSGHGDLYISEEITYRFRGSFLYAFREIPLKPGEKISRIRVREGAGEYDRSSSESPGTFTVTERSSSVTITWYYDAQDERRTFGLSYTVSGVVKRYSDVAELYCKFVSEDWDRPIGEVVVTVRLPDVSDGSQLRAWAHGPRLLAGTVVINADATVNLNVAPLPAQTYWEGRVLFPADALAGVDLHSNSPRLQAVLEEERAWADRANRLREARLKQLSARRAQREMLAKRAERYLPVSLALSILGLVLWFLAFRQHGWPHSVVSRVAPGDIPSDHRPAIVSYLMHKSVGGPAIVATLIDLADRGYFTIRETVTEKSTLFGRREETDYRFDRTNRLWGDLEPYELELAEFLITEVGDVTGFTMSNLKKTASKNRRKFLRWFQKWIKSVAEVGKTFGFFEPYPKRAMWRNAGVAIVITAFGVFFAIHSKSPVGAPAIVGGILVGILTATLNRRTTEGRRLLLAWRGFRSHLKSTAKGLGPVNLDSREWSRYLAAAIIFGMHKKLIPKINLVDNQGASTVPVWYHGAHLGGVGDGLTALAGGLTSMVNSVSTTMSSASGSGGGASVGGGGGSGGGGGGAG
jgi:uncharacterized membrane protein